VCTGSDCNSDDRSHDLSGTNPFADDIADAGRNGDADSNTGRNCNTDSDAVPVTDDLAEPDRRTDTGPDA
jgi:hypothetical protein